MSDEEAFLAAIRADPDEDAPRLVFADWLDEHGEADRAEFIRLQCRLADPSRYSVEAGDRAFDLEEQHQEEWTRHLPRDEEVAWEFRRGLPERLSLPIGGLLEEFDRWAAMTDVRSLEAYDVVAGHVPRFCEQVWAPSWSSLAFVVEPKPWLHDQFGPARPVFAGVALSPQAARLRELHIGFFGLLDEEIRALTESSYLDGLRVLTVPKSTARDPRLIARFGDRLQTNLY